MLIARLRTIFATAYDRGIISGNPMLRVKNLREAKPEVDPFDMAEALRLLEAATDWRRPFLSCLLFAGLRPNEALALGWDHIDLRSARPDPRAPQSLSATRPWVAEDAGIGT